MNTDQNHKPTGASVRLDQVQFSYPDAAPMVFDLTFKASTKVAIMGPSGSGKTTLLNLIAGFETPDAGRILIDEQEVTRLPPHQRALSMIFQENNLFSHLSVNENVGLGRLASLRLSKTDWEDVELALLQTGLQGKGKQFPSELSGGERQRVALARALVRRRPLLLLDEPLASLGPALKDEMLDLIAKIHLERGMTILMVTHDPADAIRFAHSLIFIDKGHVVASGPTAEFFSDTGPDAFKSYLGDRSL